MTTTEKIIAYGVGFVLLVLVAFIGFHEHAFGATTNPTNPSVFTAAYATESLGGLELVLGNALTGPYSVGATGNTGSLQIQPVRQNIAQATTTTCALTNPFTSTSTLMSFTYQINTGTSTPAAGIDYVVGTTTTPFATSTSIIADAYVAAGTGRTIQFDPGVNNGIIGPGQSITVGALASSSITGTGGIVTSGICSGLFEAP